VLLDIVEHAFKYLLNVQKLRKIRISKVYLSIHVYSRFIWYVVISTFFISPLNAYCPFPIIFFITLLGPPLVLWLSEGVLRQSVQKVVEKALENEGYIVVSLKDLKRAL